MDGAHDMAYCKGELVNLAIANRSTLDRWTNGASMMLFKKEADIVVTKYRAMLLLEVDYNNMNKSTFNTRLTPTLEQRNMIPREIMGGQRGM